MLESSADNAAYLDAFGERVDVDGRHYWAIVDNEFSPIEFGVELRIESNAPTLAMPTEQVKAAGIKATTVVAFRGEAFVVREIQPDGTGWTLLVLSEST